MQSAKDRTADYEANRLDGAGNRRVLVQGQVRAAGGMLPIGSSSRRLLNQSTHSSVAYLTALTTPWPTRMHQAQPVVFNPGSDLVVLVENLRP